MNKKILRKRIKQIIKSQKQLERRKKSRSIQNKVFKEKYFLTSKCVMLYVSKGTGEVETSPIIKKAFKLGKKIVLPVTLVGEKKIKPVYLEDFRHGFKKGPYGIYEPKEFKKRKKPIKIKDIDLVIVPGLAFDKKHNRLGHGGGYYDRFLKKLSKSVPKIGLGFKFQLLRKIPTTKSDISLTKIITN